MACEVCGRTLLRGEQPDVFLVSGQRRLVCELCVSRATHEGWLREGEAEPVSVRPDRRRRGRGLMGRLRDRRDQGRPSAAEDLSPAPGDGYDDGHPGAGGVDDETWSAPAEANEPAVAPPRRAPVHQAHPPAPVAADQGVLHRSPRHVRGVPSSAELKAVRALEVFNAGEAPRRIAGVARSLGPPWVSVRAPVPTGSIVLITASWELCWYRYEVDLADERADARLADQGLELDELPEDDRQPNAQADERGELQMLGAAATAAAAEAGEG